VHHLVSLISVEDQPRDREELEIVWEIEPGKSVIARAELPPIAWWSARASPADRIDRLAKRGVS